MMIIRDAAAPPEQSAQPPRDARLAAEADISTTGPGLIAGAGFALILLPATLLAIAIMALYFNALGDVKQTLRGGL
jgi:hypothetical protein